MWTRTRRHGPVRSTRIGPAVELLLGPADIKRHKCHNGAIHAAFAFAEFHAQRALRAAVIRRPVTGFTDEARERLESARKAGILLEAGEHGPHGVGVRIDDSLDHVVFGLK